MRSIRRRLVLHLAVGLTALLTVCGCVFFVSVRHALIRQFDEDLAGRLQNSLVAVEHEDLAELAYFLDSGHEGMEGMPGGAYFEIWNLQGHPMVRTRSLGGLDLPFLAPESAFPEFQDAWLPGGQRGRMAALRFTPRFDDEEDDEPVSAEGNPERHGTGEALVAALARSREDLDSTLRMLLIVLLVAAFVVPAATVVLVGWVIGYELRPLERISHAATEIGPEDLNRRLPIEKIPIEILPLCVRLNRLLDRLESAFRRERRFTSAAAHELRTPVSELRVLTEVALQESGNVLHDHDSRLYFEDALGIAMQMERLVSTLLALTRSEAGSQTVRLEPVDLSALIRQTWAPHEALLQSKGCTFSFDVPEYVFAKTDATLATGILANLFSNAAEYVPAGGHVSVQLLAGDDTLLVEVTNTHDDLESADIEHIFEPFWRKDPARTDNSHAGLGLALTASYVRLLGGDIEVHLRDPDIVVFRMILGAPLTSSLFK